MSIKSEKTTPEAARESMLSRRRKEAGARLREERQRLKLSQEAFAEQVGVHRRTQVNYESGEREPDDAYYQAAARLGVSLSYVLEGEPVEALPTFAAQLATRVFDSASCPIDGKTEALSSLFYVLGLSEVHAASHLADTIRDDQADRLIAAAFQDSEPFLEAAEAIAKYGVRLTQELSPLQRAELILGTLRVYKESQHPAGVSIRDRIRLIADDLIDSQT